MMYDSILRWMKSPGNARLASVHAASLDTIAALVLALRDPKLEVIAQRPLGDIISMRALLDGVPKPGITITRGLVKDLAIIEAADRRASILLQTRIVFDHVLDSTRRMAQTLRMLGGYDVEPSAWAPVIENQVTARLDSAVQRRDGPLLLVDCVSSISAARLWREAPQLRFAEPDTTATVTEALETDYLSRDIGPQIAPTQDLVSAHARFLVGTDMSALAAMHASVATPEFDDVFIVWRSNLAIIAAQPLNDGSAAQGMQRLADLQRHFARQKRT